MEGAKSLKIFIIYLTCTSYKELVFKQRNTKDSWTHYLKDKFDDTIDMRSKYASDPTKSFECFKDLLRQQLLMTYWLKIY